MKSWKVWTAKEVERLKTLRLLGRTTAQIAVELGRTTASIRNRLREEGIARPRNESRWLPLLSRPHSVEMLALQLGVSRYAVSAAKRRLRQRGFPVVTSPRVRRTDDGD